MTNDTSLLEGVSSGVLDVTASLVGADGDEWVRRVEAADERGILFAWSIVTSAVRPLRP